MVMEIAGHVYMIYEHVSRYMIMINPMGYPNHERYDPDEPWTILTPINPMGYPNHERYNPDNSNGLPKSRSTDFQAKNGLPRPGQGKDDFEQGKNILLEQFLEALRW